MRDLTGLDVSSTDGREKLGLGLKAMRVLGIAAPRGPATEAGAGGGRVPREPGPIRRATDSRVARARSEDLRAPRLDVAAERAARRASAPRAQLTHPAGAGERRQRRAAEVGGAELARR